MIAVVLCWCWCWCGVDGLSLSAYGQTIDFDAEPISYRDTPATDPVARLIQQIDAGEKTLAWDEQHGWLPALLDHLSIPTSSQLLVFSKTSLQIRTITPSNPRAIYFNDDVYIGIVPGARRIEIAAADPNLGAVFYGLSAKEKSRSGKQSIIERDNNSCLSCHGTAKTQNVPGFLVRSVFTESDGQPRFELGTTTTDVTTDFLKRFGGWYVTGTHGELRHRGNVFVGSDEKDASLDTEKGANQTALPARIRDGKYLTDSSDLVALMVMEQQSQVHNAIARASFTTRKTMAYQLIMNDALDRPADYVSASTERQLNSAAKNLVDHLLMKGEFQLSSPVAGSSSFVEDFQTTAIFDSKQRSLRQFDLQTRLFRYPCSYLIYGPTFDALPKPMLERVYQMLNQVLDGDDTQEFEHLSGDDRAAIHEILIDTKPSYAQFVRRRED